MFPEGFAETLEIPNSDDIEEALDEGFVDGVEAALELIRAAVKEARNGGELRFGRMQQLEADVRKLI